MVRGALGHGWAGINRPTTFHLARMQNRFSPSIRTPGRRLAVALAHHLQHVLRHLVGAHRQGPLEPPS